MKNNVVNIVLAGVPQGGMLSPLLLIKSAFNQAGATKICPFYDCGCTTPLILVIFELLKYRNVFTNTNIVYL